MGKTKHNLGRKVKKSVQTYTEKRRKNNEAIKRIREKAKAKREEIQMQMVLLKEENNEIEIKIEKLRDEILFLKDVFKRRTKTDNKIMIEEIKIENMATDEANDKNMEEKKI